MLAIVTEDGTGVVSPITLKRSGATIPISSSLRCTLSAWTSDNSQLYLAVASHIKRYTISEGLLEDMYSGPDTITCLALADKGDKVFFAAGNEVHVLDCNTDVSLALEDSKFPISSLALSNDSSLLALASESMVFVQHLTLSSRTSLHGLPSGTVSCCIFHRHASTKLLLGIDRSVSLYDVTEPSGPSKTVKLRCSSGHVVAIGSSPFSKTLIAVAVSNGDVALIDLNKEHGILKVVNLKKALTTLSFNADGGSLYLGTRDGMLLILDLRALEKEPRAIIVGEGKSSIRKIDVQESSKIASSRPPLTPGTKLSRPSACSSRIRSPAKHAPALSTTHNSPQGRTTGPHVRSPLTPVKGKGAIKSSSPLRTPFSDNRNLQSKLQTVSKPASETAKSHSSHQTGNSKARIRPQLWLTRGSTNNQESGDLKDPLPPASTSVHLPLVIDHPKEETCVSSGRRRLSSKAPGLACGSRKASVTCQVELIEAHPVHDVGYSGHETQAENPFPVLQRQPVSHQSLSKELSKATMGTDVAQGVLGLRSPELDAWVKGKREESDRKQDPFSYREELDKDGNSHVYPSTAHGSQEWADELALQVSPRRPIAAHPWTSPPCAQAQPATNLSVNATAEDFLRNIVRDVMYEFQRETKAEMTGIHLDLVRMGRGWRQELKEAIERWEREAKQLREENERLKEENERLRRGT
ncbi:WD40-repeat-containing domain protein [Pisolithus croceorrhizus]|nr:WD40-repeat-containing domain protein [Pisolithus croceorrhizus]KAI6132042.1 WD40-repeat-containing domain protein [Pisolithus croceorrhizus]